MIGWTTFRSASSGATAWANARPSLLARLLSFIVLAILAVVVGLILLPVLVIGILLGLTTILARSLGIARRPNGLLDGRRNVRVIQPGAAPPDVNA